MATKLTRRSRGVGVVVISVLMEPVLPCLLQAVLQVALARPLDDFLRAFMYVPT